VGLTGAIPGGRSLFGIIAMATESVNRGKETEQALGDPRLGEGVWEVWF
jgi:hypothetical protein